MKRIRLLLTIIFLTVLKGTLCAQNIRTVDATYVYVSSPDESPKEAQEKAIERAKLQAIADEFGTLVTQTGITHVVNVNGKSSINFDALGGTEVKGEWIETIGEPEIKQIYDSEKNMFVTTCNIEGCIREIKSAPVDFEAKVLYNPTDLQSEKYEFLHGERFYLSFMAPVNGYVAVYMVDNVRNKAFRLLPDRYDDDGLVSVNRDQSYCFFSKKMAPRGQRVSEYITTCQGDVEVNYLYVLFSPNRFFKVLDGSITTDDSHNLVLPNSLSVKKFQKWLTNCRIKDEEMRIDIKSITCKNTDNI